MSPTRKQRKSKPTLYAGLILLLAGGCIYLFFRQGVLFLSRISPDTLASVRISVPKHENSLLLYLFLYCIPDGLWYAALLTLQVHFASRERAGKVLLLFSILLPFMLEFAQLFGLVPGTFDYYDLFTYLITLILFIPCAKKLLSN